MPTTDELFSIIESLNSVLKAQSNRIDSLSRASESMQEQLSLISVSYFAFAKDSPSLELISKLRQDDAKVFETLRNRTQSAFNLCNCRIELLTSINIMLIARVGKLFNEEEKKKFESEIRQKYNDMIAGFLNDDSIPEESKTDLKKVAESGLPLFVVR